MKEGLFLSKQDQFKFRQIAEFNAGKISRLEAAKLLDLSERMVSRLAARVGKDGFSDVVHRNRGKPAHNRSDERVKLKTMKLVASKYYDFNMLHCLEILKTRHKIAVGRERFRRWCHEKQLVKRKKRRRSHPRFYRSRMPAEGYLLQMDGSPHKYNGRDIWSLILAIDDATSEIPHTEFFESETTSACMKVLVEIIQKKGVPRAMYVDKAGWAGGGKRVEFTQFHRACDELGIQVLYANSPQAKGRVERAFDTFQDRIIPELRVKRIRSMKDANTYLSKHFLPKYWNRRNTVAPRSPASEYRRLPKTSHLEEIFCYKKMRCVDNGQRISVNGDIYQLKHPRNMQLARKRVELRFYDNKPISVFFENSKLEIKRVHRYKPEQKDWHEKIKEMEGRFGLRRRKLDGTFLSGN